MIAMGHLVIEAIDDRALAKLQERARRRGVPVDQLVREIIEVDALLSPTIAQPEPKGLTDDERAERRKIAERMAEIRARTLKPLWADSALLIREDRDTR
jgi:hypothetical protein